MTCEEFRETVADDPFTAPVAEVTARVLHGSRCAQCRQWLAAKLDRMFQGVSQEERRLEVAAADRLSDVVSYRVRRDPEALEEVNRYRKEQGLDPLPEAL